MVRLDGVHETRNPCLKKNAIIGLLRSALVVKVGKPKADGP